MPPGREALVEVCLAYGVFTRLLHGYPWVPLKEGGPDPWVTRPMGQVT
jgi:hypothetical protein